ncbi:hypothetical protein SAMN04488508_101678 [Aquimarina spongiae]|uniref:Outer membrane protein beta-barrel family protein n=2 Tax=Aquimarina spongiae TaxID=570521 RepID=A0A1M6B8J9_9FLAO|nr:hypothetical protein SAMN04488508_101678 [Aquimarina spongiae]
MHAQQERPTDSLGPRVTTSGAKYTDDSSHDFNANFEVNYRVNSNLFFQIRGYRDKNASQDLFGGSFFAKKYVTKRFYMYSGLSAEFMGGVFPDESISVKLSQFNMANGMGYDLNKNFTIEVENLINVKQNFGGFSNQNDFSVRGKFKF